MSIYGESFSLVAEDRDFLVSFLHAYTKEDRTHKRAEILLFSNRGWGKGMIADRIGVALSTVQRVRDRYREGGLAHALSENLCPGAPPKLTKEGIAHLYYLKRSDPPKGKKRWTLNLLREKMIEDKMAPKTITTICLRTYLLLQDLTPNSKLN